MVRSVINPGVASVCRMVGYCLTIQNEPAMWHLSAILYARLAPRERVFLAVAALMSLDDAEYSHVIDFMEGHS